MVAQKSKQKFSAKIFCIFNAYSSKTHQIKSLNSLDTSRSYKKLLENQKTGGSRDLFLPENYFQASSTKNFSKNYPDFAGLETNPRHEIQI